MLRKKVVEVFKYFKAKYPQKTKVVRDKFTDDEWKSIVDFVSQPGKMHGK